MIERYSTKEMRAIWSEESNYFRWLVIEKAVNDTIQGKLIPANSLSEQLSSLCLIENLSWVVQKAKEYEKETNHDVVAFLFAIEDLCADGKWAHWGLTSSDIKDTGLSLAIQKSFRELSSASRELIETCFGLYQAHTNVLIGARTHGQLAEPVRLPQVFFKFISELWPLVDKIDSWEHKGKLSGAVGNNRIISEDLETKALAALGLNRTKTATQVIQRTYHAEVIFTLCLLVALIEKMALQIRLWQQSGVEEISEGFGDGQTGSSAMPHKHNPIDCENLCGVARLVRSYVSPALEDIALWGFRDMTHSSVERVVFPDIFNLTHYSVIKLTKILRGLKINTKKIEEHLKQIPESQDRLLELIKAGHSRKEAYYLTQRGK